MVDVNSSPVVIVNKKGEEEKSITFNSFEDFEKGRKADGGSKKIGKYFYDSDIKAIEYFSNHGYTTNVLKDGSMEFTHNNLSPIHYYVEYDKVGNSYKPKAMVTHKGLSSPYVFSDNFYNFSSDSINSDSPLSRAIENDKQQNKKQEIQKQKPQATRKKQFRYVAKKENVQKSFVANTGKLMQENDIKTGMIDTKSVKSESQYDGEEYSPKFGVSNAIYYNKDKGIDSRRGGEGRCVYIEK